MAQDTPGAKEVLTIHMSEALAKRLKLAAAKANCSPAEVALEVLNKNLPRLPIPGKQIPYT